ncbi:thioesterase II family protein [Streptomyces microflavus]|uniref:thioesterase II family protein n=1 Tax=Streptomyces microflavus TaxID=1919 RepID=UPI00342B1AD1
MPQGQPIRLYCFAHAGAGVSSFSRWTTAAAPGIDVVPVLLPGRDTRRREPRVTGRRALLADLLRTVGPPPSGPYVLYGHSLGGLIVYTVTRALREAGLNPPALVVVGASPPPDVTGAVLRHARRPDEELVRALGELGAVPPGTARGGVWERTALPVLRDDLRLAGALKDSADRPLDTPLLVVSGRDDRLAPPELMAGWRKWTSGRVVERTVRGDHFFVRGPELPRLLRRACHVVRRTADRAPDARLAEGRNQPQERNSR